MRRVGFGLLQIPEITRRAAENCFRNNGFPDPGKKAMLNLILPGWPRCFCGSDMIRAESNETYVEAVLEGGG